MERIIQNFDALAENELRTDALAIAEAGFAAIDIRAAITRSFIIENDELRISGRTIRLAGRRIFFVGVGKCAFAAAESIESLLGDRLAGGIALDVFPERKKLTKIETCVGTHPLPSETNEHATARILAFLSGMREDDLVIMLISGGGSALLCSYEEPMTFADESALFKELTAHGIAIQEMNTIRKHTSRARGGGLSRAAFPAEVLSIIVSDVPENDIEFISSGPTARDTSTVKDASDVLARYDVSLPSNARLIETTKEAEYFARVDNLLFLTNRDALVAMRDEAARRGYATEIASDHFSGEARDIGRAIIEKLHKAPGKSALLYAGESTVVIPKNSEPCEHAPTQVSPKGGRNQEMVLAVLETLNSDELILPFSSDGHDNTDAAGAIGDNLTREHARTKGLSANDHLEKHLSYDFFKETGDALHTGYTGSNVSDLVVTLKN